MKGIEVYSRVHFTAESSKPLTSYKQDLRSRCKYMTCYLTRRISRSVERQRQGSGLLFCSLVSLTLGNNRSTQLLTNDTGSIEHYMYYSSIEPIEHGDRDFAGFARRSSFELPPPHNAKRAGSSSLSSWS
ncbi:hypothetical protein EJ03DRAFT_99902 [Teratosphaeria nubilosa]|uniref:Uncharacterized protein n=1 Tax=Teratosphaeria nubilosa TaxID=161662 RepID=A0A6G1L8N7_9PEZI|nr:hypothetical protein EJ03DRAFT_99902 [Teratosphaeria nubilosa]